MAAVLTPEAKAAETQALVARVREGSLGMQFGQAGLQLRHLEDAIAFAKQMIEGGLCPKGVNRPGAVIWMVQRGAELGIGPTAAMDSFYIGPSGKPELYAKAALGICVARGVLDENYELWAEGSGKETVAFFKFRRRNWKEPRLRQFAWKEAEQAQLCKPDSNWLKWPQRMCQARVVAFAVKDFFSDVTLGCQVEGDQESEVIQGQVTEISREITPSAPDPLFDQLKKAETEDPTDPWSDFTAAVKAEPEDDGSVNYEPPVEPGAPTPLIDMPPVNPFKEPEPPRVQMATKEKKEWFYSLCRTRGLNDVQITQRLGTAGYENIDQVPADVLAEMTKKVEAAKPKGKGK